MFRRLAVPVLLAVAAAAGAGGVGATAAPSALAEEKPIADVADDVAKQALERFQTEFKRDGPSLRAEAVLRLGKVLHPSVASALLDVAFKSEESPVRTAAFKGLANQTTSPKLIGPKVSKFLGEAAAENRKRKARGDYGVRIDPKTGKTDTESEEGKALLRAKRERGQMLAEAMKVLDATGHRDKDGVEVLIEFLGDGNDDLVVAAMNMLGKWKEWSALPEFVDLFEMYPAEDKYNSGSTAVDTGAAGSADQQAAKRAWMAKYGDPDRRRARPPVVRAMKQAIFDITGEKVETPDALREFLRRPDVKRKVKAK